LPASEAVDLDEAAARMAASVRDAGALALSMFGRPIRTWTKFESSPVSDADIAVVLNGPHGNRTAAAIDMAGIAFDVLLETGVLVEALPLWQDEIQHPESFGNPALIETIRRDGVRL
jgi:hypothetical protein